MRGTETYELRRTARIEQALDPLRAAELSFFFFFCEKRKVRVAVESPFHQAAQAKVPTEIICDKDVAYL